jgi:hypothetical protein
VGILRAGTTRGPSTPVVDTTEVEMRSWQEGCWWFTLSVALYRSPG